jgi:hypothetical protein
MRLTRLVAVSTTSLALLAGSAAAASAAPATTTTTTKPPAATSTSHSSDAKSHLEWRVISGTFKTKAAAENRVAKLNAKTATGFSVLHRHQRWEVERTFTTKAAARAEARTVRKDGFHARVVAISVR